jgi:hypothetical protein
VSTLVVNTKNGHQKHTEHMLRALTYDWTVKYDIVAVSLLVEETGVPGENYLPVTDKLLSHNVL